jgi:integrase
LPFLRANLRGFTSSTTFLNRAKAQVGAGFEQVGSEAMAEHVGIDRFLNPSAAGGVDLHTIQILLGHHDLKETARYLHLSQRHLHATPSPLDALGLKKGRSSEEE